MAFKNILVKVRRALLCCSKRSLDIGSPTDVRRVDISDALPGLTDDQRKYIREKASSDAIHLLGINSLPPSHPPTNLPSPTESPIPSQLSSREPSVALLNAASSNLPSNLPTPPRQRHNESSPPAAYMKSTWDSAARSNRSSTDSGELYEDLDGVKGEHKSGNESFTTLNLGFDWEDKHSGDEESVHTLTTSECEGFEMQDTVGGRVVDERSPMMAKTPPSEKTNKVLERAVTSTSLADSSDSEVDSFVVGESSPLVRA